MFRRSYFWRQFWQRIRCALGATTFSRFHAPFRVSVYHLNAPASFQLDGARRSGAFRETPAYAVFAITVLCRITRFLSLRRYTRHIRERARAHSADQIFIFVPNTAENNGFARPCAPRKKMSFKFEMQISPFIIFFFPFRNDARVTYLFIGSLFASVPNARGDLVLCSGSFSFNLIVFIPLQTRTLCFAIRKLAYAARFLLHAGYIEIADL